MSPITTPFSSLRRLSRIAGILAGGAAALSAGSAAAYEWEAQVGVASQYVGKGIGKSDGEPSVFGSAEIGAGDLYAGVRGSTAKLPQGSNAEIVTSIGYRPKIAGLNLDVSVMNKELPGTRTGVDRNYMEYQADVSRSFGRTAFRLRINYSPDGFASTREAWWVEAQGAVSLDAKTKVSVALAERTADGGAEYTAWNAGVKRKLTDRIALDVRWYDTDGHSFGDRYDGRLVGALSFDF